MSIPPQLLPGLRLPVVVAPMFIVSGVDLVLAACSAGVIGTVPAMNFRSSRELDAGLLRIAQLRRAGDATFGVNLIVGADNERLHEDLKVVVENRVPLVITSFGADLSVVEAIHGYGGVIFHDVATPRHIEVAAASGVDGLILLTQGAGGHCGKLNPFAILHEARKRFEGTLLLAGAISTGADILSAQGARADFSYMGTRFIATQEANAHPTYKSQIVRGGAMDVVTTRALTGTAATFLTESMRDNGLDPTSLTGSDALERDQLDQCTGKPWKDIWSAGQGIGAISDVPSCRVLVDTLLSEYRASHEALEQGVLPFLGQ